MDTEDSGHPLGIFTDRYPNRCPWLREKVVKLDYVK